MAPTLERSRRKLLRCVQKNQYGKVLGIILIRRSGLPHRIRMQKLGILLVLVVCIQVPLSSTFSFGKLVKDGQTRVTRSVDHNMQKPSQGNSWIGEFGADLDYSKMSNEEVSETMMLKMRMKMKRMLQPLRDLFIRVLDLGPKHTIPGRPAFCGDRECPQYTILKKHKHYELRSYPAARWVSTRMQARKMNAKAVSIGFWRLFKYFQGKNELRKRIQMTTPIITTIKSDPRSSLKNFTMSFYLPQAITNPPLPNDKTVFIETKTFKVYAHGFSEFAVREKTWKKHAVMLQKMLKRDSLTGRFYTHNKRFVTASYDDPMKLFNPHNEVWLFAKENNGKK